MRVEKGHYREQLVIDKPLTLKGINRPTLSGGFKGDTIRITAEDVVIDGLIVRDSGDSLIDQNAGIYIQPGAHRAAVRNCDLTYNLFGSMDREGQRRARSTTTSSPASAITALPGAATASSSTTPKARRSSATTSASCATRIYVDVSHHAVFRDNRMHHSRYGTHYMNSYYNVWEGNDSYHNRGGLALMEVRDQVVRNNRAWGNSDHGIMLRTIQDSVVEDNVVAGNARGFFIYDAEYNTLRNNLVVDNIVGVHLCGRLDQQPGRRQ